MIDAALFLFSIACVLVICSSSTLAMKRPALISRKNIPKLRNIGQRFFEIEKYEEASCCYSALLQILEGSSGREYSALRRTFSLKLALCDLNQQRFHRAIARCSEVLNETPDINIDDQTNQVYSLSELEKAASSDNCSIIHDLGLALLTRGKCLRAVGERELAQLDFNLALRYIPDEVEVYKEITDIESAMRTEQVLVSNTNTIDTSQQAEEKAASVRGAEFIEECILKYPSVILTPKQLRELCAVEEVALPRVSKPSNAAAGGGGGPLLSELLGGLGTGGKGKGSGGGGMNLKTLSGMVSPGLLGMLGMEPKSAQNAAEVLRAVADSLAFFQGLYKQIVHRHRDAIVLALTAVWVALTLRTCLHSM